MGGDVMERKRDPLWKGCIPNRIFFFVLYIFTAAALPNLLNKVLSLHFGK